MTKTVTVPDLSDLYGQTLTPELEAEVKRRVEAAGLQYGGADEPKERRPCPLCGRTDNHTHTAGPFGMT